MGFRLHEKIWPRTAGRSSCHTFVWPERMANFAGLRFLEAFIPWFDGDSAVVAAATKHILAFQIA